ncbi:MAG: ABC transporter ATP-binding protein [Bavariicoccus seileri]|uniref:ABC transporter ATP-binding protein n=1 Tax=Bavariicoccus seileri TaxID=549685 RepID=UPI003F91A57B
MILEAKDLSFAYGKKAIFTECAFSIDQAGIYGLVAPNGSGKTTLLNLLSGLYQPNQGTVTLVDAPLSDKNVFHNLTFLQDSSVLYPYLSAKDHLDFVAKVHHIPTTDVLEAIRYLEMESYWESPLSSYSMGMKQRTLLAIGLITDSQLLFLDEPLNGLDPTSTILIRKAIQKMAEKGRTVVVSSHNLNEIDKITSTILFIKDKSVWLEDIHHYQKTVVVLSLAPEATDALTLALRKQKYHYVVEQGHYTILARQSDGVDIVNLLVNAQIPVLSFTKQLSGSEQRYQELFGVK